MATSDENPYSPPTGSSQQEFVKGKPWAVDYFGGFSVALQSPNWLTNAFLCGLIGIVPILGQIVGLGYAFEVAEGLHRSNGIAYPDFTFQRFSDYLTRGVGPFLVQFVIGLVFGLAFAAILIVLMIAGMVAAQGNENAMGLMLGVTNLGSNVLQIALQIVVLTIALPFMVRGGLSGEIGQAFNFQLGLETLKRTWMASFVFSLVWYLAFAVLGFLGCLMLCIGIIPVIGYLYGVLGWNGYQLYRLALAEGMPPVPLKPLPQPMAS